MKKKLFFGRIKSRKISIAKKNCFKSFIVKNKISHINKKKQLLLEIGIGMGESLIHLSKKHKKKSIIGVDPFLNGMVNVSDYCLKKNIKNIYLYPFVFQRFLKRFNKLNFNAIYILFPDPWPKQKHHKRRIINELFIKKILNILKKNGKVYLSTDNLNYYENIILILKKLKITNIKKIKKIITIKTKYYLKAEKKKNKINSLMFSKI